MWDLCVKRHLWPIWLFVSGAVSLGAEGVLGGTTDLTVPDAPAIHELMAMSQDAQSGQIVVGCLVAGKPARLILDTGATHTVVSERFARAHLEGVPRLDMSRIKVVGNASGVPEILHTEVVAGGVKFQGVAVLVLDLAGVNELLREPVDGVLGMDVLRYLSFVLDFSRKVFTWGAFTDRSFLAPLEGERDEAGRWFVRVQRGSQVMSLLLDTGCSRTVAVPGVWPAARKEGIPLLMADVQGKRAVEMCEGKPEELLLSPGVRSAVVDPVLSPEREGDGLLGVDALRANVLMHLSEKKKDGGFYVGPVRDR